MAHQRRIDEQEEAGEPARSPAAPQPAPAAAQILGLQQSMGNAAVTRLLARDQYNTPAPAPGMAKPPPGPPPLSEEERIKKLDADYKAAVDAADYDTAAKLLNAYMREHIIEKLKAFDEGQLRRLDDGAKRSMPGYSGNVRGHIKNRLGELGITGTKAESGGKYGKIDLASQGTVKGEEGKTAYRYKIEITFEPDSGVPAEEIAFIQRLRLVDRDTGENKDWDEASRRRATARKSAIDRTKGSKQGWYSLNDDKSDGRLTTKWVKGAGKKDAWMQDHPGSKDLPNTSWEFETAAVSLKGPDEGTVYATVTWGFTVDGDMNVTPLKTEYFNKESAEMDRAVSKWNEQAKGPADQSNVPGGGQATLPTLN